MILPLEDLTGDDGSSFTGLCRWITGDSCAYEGQLVNGKRQGCGRFVFANGDVYDGEWAEDTFEGLGIYESQEGRYEGMHKGGVWSGKGSFTWPNGDKYTVK